MVIIMVPVRRLTKRVSLLDRAEWG